MTDLIAELAEVVSGWRVQADKLSVEGNMFSGGTIATLRSCSDEATRVIESEACATVSRDALAVASQARNKESERARKAGEPRNDTAELQAAIAAVLTPLSADYQALVVRLGEVTTELEKARKDVERWSYLVRENNKGGRGAFRIVWFDDPGEGFVTTDGVSIDGKDEEAIVRIIDAAMHDSARDGSDG